MSLKKRIFRSNMMILFTRRLNRVVLEPMKMLIDGAEQIKSGLWAEQLGNMRKKE